MSLTSTLARAPKWSYFTAAGLVGGGVLIYTIKNRNAPDPTTEDTSVTDGYGDPGSGYWGGSSSMVPGIVVPPIISGSGDSGVVQPDASVVDSYNGAIIGVIDSFGTIISGQQQMLADILTGGGAPSNPAPSGSSAAPPPAAAAAPPPAAPKSCCGSKFPYWDSSRAKAGNCNSGCFTVRQETHCKKVGTKKRKFKRTIRDYYEGPSKVISDINTGVAC